MGELLQFPGGENAGEEGAGRRPASSSRTRRALPPGLEESLDEIGRRFGPGSRSSDTAEPEWAVPVIGTEEQSAEKTPGPGGDSRTGRRAANVAMATLARHDASEGEVRARLVAKGLDEAEIEAELDRLRSVGLIDDVRFAERLVGSLRERKGLGDAAVRTALRARSVPSSVIDAVLADQAEDDDALQGRLQSVADDRARRLASLAPEVAERRLTAYLLRKGYAGSAVRAAVRTALDGRR